MKNLPTVLRAGVATLNQTAADWYANRDRLIQALALAKKQGVKLLLTPEMSIPGYGLEDRFLHEESTELAWEMLEQILPHTKGMVAVFGLPYRYENRTLYNTAAVVVDGVIVALAAKTHLANDGVHYESRWFKAFPIGVSEKQTYRGHTFLFGDVVICIDGIRIGFEICEASWSSDRPGSQLANRGVDIILNPSASHGAFGKHEVRERFVGEGSRAFTAAYMFANLVGNDSGRKIYDGGSMVAVDGTIIARSKRLSFQDVEVTACLVDIAIGRNARVSPAWAHPKFDAGSNERSLAPGIFEGGLVAPLPRECCYRELWESYREDPNEFFTRMLTLGLYDYVRKSPSKGFVVSLSGGVDSSAVVVLVRQMVELGCRELGAPGFLCKLPNWTELQGISSVDQIVSRILVTIYQGTRNSSDVTREAAAEVAKAVGAEHHNVSVEEPFVWYTAQAAQLTGSDLLWSDAADNIVLQNLQARARSLLFWAIANRRGFLPLTTSNLSEAGAGYCTMDGDTAGGLAPLGGISKSFLQSWLHWVEKVGPRDLPPMPVLRLVNSQKPTAELQPPEFRQSDENDLGPYPVLDCMIHVALFYRQGPTGVFQALRVEPAGSGYTDWQLLEWTKNFFRRWARSQWKRERYAPSFMLGPTSVDPKTWCRWPILGGNFQAELDRLERFYEETLAEAA